MLQLFEIEHCRPEWVVSQIELIFLLKTMTVRNVFFVGVDFISLSTVISRPKIFLLALAPKPLANSSSTQKQQLASIFALNGSKYCQGLSKETLIAEEPGISLYLLY